MKVLILVLVLILTLQYQIAKATNPVLYVRASDGVDNPGCGTSISPCKSITRAAANHDSSTTTIKVAQGDYPSEQIVIQNDLPDTGSGQFSIEGGWNADFTIQSHDPSLTRTTPTDNHAVIHIAPGTVHSVRLRVAYLTLQGTTDLQRYGLYAYSDYGSLTELGIEHCHIVSFRGNGISLGADTSSAMTVTVHDTTIRGNYQPLTVPPTSPWTGGGVYVSSYGNSTVTVVMTNNMIVANQASTGGGIRFFTNGATLNATLENNILAENQAEEQRGGAISAEAFGNGIMDLTLTNNTISNNLAALGAGGISFYSGNAAEITARFKNTIVWGNTLADICIDTVSSVPPIVNTDYSLIGVAVNSGGTYTSTSHNLAGNPVLTANYHLTGASPAKDTGLCGSIFHGGYIRAAPYDDIDGNVRPGDGILSGCDIGADEYRFPWSLFNPVITGQQ